MYDIALSLWQKNLGFGEIFPEMEKVKVEGDDDEAGIYRMEREFLLSAHYPVAMNSEHRHRC